MDEPASASSALESAIAAPGVRSRPLLHFTARAGWINDPVGLIWHGDRYHLFFQHLPGSTRGATGMHWGHATSLDLVHWDEHRVAISPGDGDDGIWSGSVTVGPSTPKIFYTAVDADDIGRGRVRVAVPADDDWIVWIKGPTVAVPAHDLDVRMCRDPQVYASADGWRMLIGAGLANGDAGALTYSSIDQLNWRYDGIAARRSTATTEPVWTGTGWECPQLVHVDGHAVLVVAVWTEDDLCYVAYAEVDEEGSSLAPKVWRRLTFGTSHYAPLRFSDAEAREGLLFWLRGVGDGPDGSWAGALSVPYLLAFKDGHLVLTPHPSVRTAWPTGPVRPGASDGPHLYATWRPREGDAVELWGRDERWRLTHVGPEVVVTRNDVVVVALPMGGDEVDVMADGPVLEVCTRRAVYATAVPPLSVVADATRPERFEARRPEPIAR
jgi:beta-fructofuranosidase